MQQKWPRVTDARPIPDLERRAVGGSRMDMRTQTVDWAAVNADPRFRELHRRKSTFLWGLMGFSVLYYFLLPLGAAYATGLFKVKLWGPVNVGLVFAWSEFLVAWGIAFIYARRANREFDALAAEINRDALAKAAGATP
jgi:uncharacterized membrane protein (DUF485 family)